MPCLDGHNAYPAHITAMLYNDYQLDGHQDGQQYTASSTTSAASTTTNAFYDQPTPSFTSPSFTNETLYSPPSSIESLTKDLPACQDDPAAFINRYQEMGDTQGIVGSWPNWKQNNVLTVNPQDILPHHQVTEAILPSALPSTPVMVYTIPDQRVPSVLMPPLLYKSDPFGYGKVNDFEGFSSKWPSNREVKGAESYSIQRQEHYERQYIPSPPPFIPSPNKENPAAKTSQRGRSPSKESGTRGTNACKSCHKKKMKCSEERPSCANCVKKGIECIYPEGPRRRGPAKKPTKKEQRRIRKVSDTDSTSASASTSASVSASPLEMRMPLQPIVRQWEETQVYDPEMPCYNSFETKDWTSAYPSL
jgi:hypothetical protein